MKPINSFTIFSSIGSLLFSMPKKNSFILRTIACREKLNLRICCWFEPLTTEILLFSGGGRIVRLNTPHSGLLFSKSGPNFVTTSHKLLPPAFFESTYKRGGGPEGRCSRRGCGRRCQRGRRTSGERVQEAKDPHRRPRLNGPGYSRWKYICILVTYLILHLSYL